MTLVQRDLLVLTGCLRNVTHLQCPLSDRRATVPGDDYRGVAGHVAAYLSQVSPFKRLHNRIDQNQESVHKVFLWNLSVPLWDW